jgi:endonuclease YncB( thermonuclease family)
MSIRTPVTILVAAVGCVAFLAVEDALARGNSRGSSSGYKSYRGAKAIDGDTYRYQGQRYRVQQYNAPERGSPGSRQATQSLQRNLDSGSHEYKPVARDAYGRTIVRERRDH